jgi:hypothetical protein
MKEEAVQLPHFSIGMKPNWKFLHSLTYSSHSNRFILYLGCCLFSLSHLSDLLFTQLTKRYNIVLFSLIFKTFTSVLGFTVLLSKLLINHPP